MSDDWVKNYMQRLERKRQEELARMTKARWAEQGAADAFNRLRKRLKQDVEFFHAAGGDRSLGYAEAPPKEVMIRKANYPSVTLEVELQGVTIHYRTTFLHDGTGIPQEDSYSLRIASNSEGAVQIYRNGTAFVDESEVSELLLTPVFDFIA